MTSFSDVREGLRNRLLTLPGVAVRREFGNEAFFVGENKVAALTDRALVLHLPSRQATDALKSGQARPFVSVGALSRHGWIEMPLANLSPQLADPWIEAAYRRARHGHRRSSARKPPGARRLRTRGST